MKSSKAAAGKSAPAKQGSAAKVPFNFRLAPKHLDRARTMAEHKGVDVSAIIQLALSEYLEREEQRLKRGAV